MRGEECAYEDKKWRTKDHLRSEIERLRVEQRQGNALIRALTNNDPKQWETVLDRMRAGDPPDSIAEWILAHSPRTLSGASSSSPKEFTKSAETPQNVAALLQKGAALGGATTDVSQLRSFCSREPFAPQVSTMAFSLRTANISVPLPDTPRRMDLSPPHISADLGPSIWTKVTSDTALVQQLLAKFFSSSIPSLALVSEPQFVQDFREARPRYCSEALVNAILGLACRVTITTSQQISRVSYGDAFVGEAKALLAQEKDHVNLPSIQALGALSLAEMSQGNETEASELARESVRACIRFLLQTRDRDHDHDDGFRRARALSYCGGFSLIR